MKYVLLIMATAACALAADLPGSVCDVTANGAKGDGVVLDTAAIQKAIDTCAAAGGGVVWFPSGNFLSGTIVLKNNITLHISPGATLWGSKRIEDYNPYHLIYAKDAENIAIEGGGVINGNGLSYFDTNSQFSPEQWFLFKYNSKERPSPLIELVTCHNVRVEDLSIRNSPGWTIHPLGSDGVKIHAISIVNHRQGPSTDGIDVDSSRNVQISDSYIEAGDDCIVIKTTGRLGGKTMPSENITVTNCVLGSTWNNVKLGTESLGEFKNISISNCVMFRIAGSLRPPMGGLAIEMVDGSTLDGLVATNLTMREVAAPIFIRLGNRGRGMQTPVPGTLQNVSISNVVATGATLTTAITGLPGHPVRFVSLDNINITMKGGGKEKRGLDVAENAEKYPEAAMFGTLPAYGFYVRHVEGLTMRNVQVRWEEPDARPAAIFDEVRDLDIDGFQPEGVAAQPALWLNNVVGALVSKSRARLGVKAGLRITGADSKAIRLALDDLAPDLGGGAPKSALLP
jgi:polygalacturonase